jgi:hypothetical protein
VKSSSIHTSDDNEETKPPFILHGSKSILQNTFLLSFLQHCILCVVICRKLGLGNLEWTPFFISQNQSVVVCRKLGLGNLEWSTPDLVKVEINPAICQICQHSRTGQTGKDYKLTHQHTKSPILIFSFLFHFS